MKQRLNRIKSNVVIYFRRCMNRCFNPTADYLKFDFKSDAEAIRSDWEAVGQDMWKAVKRFEREKDGIHVD